MKGATLATLLTVVASSEAQFNALEHLGGNSPFFKGPNVFDISSDAPEGCSVDQAAFSSRHGSRYPDPGAYKEWVNLSTKVIIRCNSATRYTKIDWLNRFTPKTSAPMLPSWHFSSHGSQF
jgi:acid phosphatase